MSERDATEDALREAAHDAFVQFWRAAETDQAVGLWAAYCAAQARYDAYLNAEKVTSSEGQGAPLSPQDLRDSDQITYAKMRRPQGPASRAARTHASGLL